MIPFFPDSNAFPKNPLTPLVALFIIDVTLSVTNSVVIANGINILCSNTFMKSLPTHERVVFIGLIIFTSIVLPILPSKPCFFVLVPSPRSNPSFEPNNHSLNPPSDALIVKANPSKEPTTGPEVIAPRIPPALVKPPPNANLPINAPAPIPNNLPAAVLSPFLPPKFFSITWLIPPINPRCPDSSSPNKNLLNIPDLTATEPANPSKEPATGPPTRLTSIPLPGGKNPIVPRIVPAPIPRAAASLLSLNQSCTPLLIKPPLRSFVSGSTSPNK